eukprot:g194.t1
MTLWLMNFLVPPLCDHPTVNVQHPSFNTPRKRFLCGRTHTIHHELPFRFKFGIALVILVIIFEVILAIYAVGQYRDDFDVESQVEEQKDITYDLMMQRLLDTCINISSIVVPPICDSELVDAIRAQQSRSVPASDDVISDFYASSDVLCDCMIAAAVIGSLSTGWFLCAFVTGVVQKIRLLREGKKVFNFRYRDVQEKFGVSYQSKFIGAIFSFYVVGNLLNIFVWWLVFILFAYEPIFDSITKPLIEWTLFFGLSYCLNMAMTTFLYDRQVSDPHFFYRFKNSSIYFLADFLLFAYYIAYMGMALIYKVLYGILILLGLIFRMDLTNYGEGVEMMDTGFATVMALIALNERVNNPIMRVFSRCTRVKSTDLPMVAARRRARLRWKLAYTLVRNPSIVKHRLEEHEVGIDFVEISYGGAGPASIWGLHRSLRGHCLYHRQWLNTNGVTFQINGLLKNQQYVTGGAVRANTKLICRSRACELIWLVQVSREMFEFADDGDLYWEKMINNFMRRIFVKWDALKVHHSLTVILFARGQKYDDTRSTDQLDYYEVALDNARCLDETWERKLLPRIRIAFHKFYRRLKRSWSGSNVYLSCASDGNLIEAVHMTLNRFDTSFREPDLELAGQSIVIMTASCGTFWTDTDLNSVAELRMKRSGIGCDLVCMAEPPLHAVPLFILRDRGSASSQTRHYDIPHWAHISFYKSYAATSENDSKYYDHIVGASSASRSDAFVSLPSAAVLLKRNDERGEDCDNKEESADLTCDNNLDDSKRGRSRLVDLRNAFTEEVANPDLKEKAFGALFNPFRPQSDFMRWLTSRRQRWSHLYPNIMLETSVSVPKWKSLCEPAVLPITTMHFPSMLELFQNFNQNMYKLSLANSERVGASVGVANNHTYLLDEMVRQRLARGYQLAVREGEDETGRRVDSDKQSERREKELYVRSKHVPVEYLMSSGKQIHQLMYDPIDDEVKVREFTMKSERERSKAAHLRIETPFFKFNPFRGKWVQGSASFGLKEKVHWNSIDQELCEEEYNYAAAHIRSERKYFVSFDDISATSASTAAEAFEKFKKCLLPRNPYAVSVRSNTGRGRMFKVFHDSFAQERQAQQRQQEWVLVEFGCAEERASSSYRTLVIQWLCASLSTRINPTIDALPLYNHFPPYRSITIPPTKEPRPTPMQPYTVETTLCIVAVHFGGDIIFAYVVAAHQINAKVIPCKLSKSKIIYRVLGVSIV